MCIIEDLKNSLDIRFPTKITNNVLSIINDKVIIHFRDSSHSNMLNYKVLAISTGNLLEEGNLIFFKLDKVACVSCSREYDSGYYQAPFEESRNANNKYLGEFGRTDLNEIMPKTIEEIMTIINFYSK